MRRQDASGEGSVPLLSETQRCSDGCGRGGQGYLGLQRMKGQRPLAQGGGEVRANPRGSCCAHRLAIATGSSVTA